MICLINHRSKCVLVDRHNQASKYFSVHISHNTHTYVHNWLSKKFHKSTALHIEQSQRQGSNKINKCNCQQLRKNIIFHIHIYLISRRFIYDTKLQKAMKRIK
jgi:hypothetical protein